MKARDTDAIDPDDMFADTRMTFGEHIEDLRTHLIRAIYGFLLAFVIAIPLGQPVLDYISAPVEKQLQLFAERVNGVKEKQFRAKIASGALPALPSIPVTIDIDRNVIQEMIDEAMERTTGKPAKAPEKKPLENLEPGLKSLLKSLGVEDAVDWRVVTPTQFIRLQGQVANPLDHVATLTRIKNTVYPQSLKTLRVEESFMVLFKVILMTGLVLGSPWIFYQIWMFIAAGLYPSEKRLVNVYLPFSLGLFLIGVFSCEIFVIPKAVEALLWFNEYLGYEPDLRLTEWLGFAIFMPLVFGISFQTPLVMFFLEKIGLFSVETYKGMRKVAWLVLCVFAAVITPSTDAFSMLFLWVPMCLLYELGIWLCRFSARPRQEEWETSEPGEMVEV